VLSSTLPQELPLMIAQHNAGAVDKTKLTFNLSLPLKKFAHLSQVALNKATRV